jgi:hypothetical protein
MILCIHVLCCFALIYVYKSTTSRREKRSFLGLESLGNIFFSGLKTHAGLRPAGGSEAIDDTLYPFYMTVPVSSSILYRADLPIRLKPTYMICIYTVAPPSPPPRRAAAVVSECSANIRRPVSPSLNAVENGNTLSRCSCDCSLLRGKGRSLFLARIARRPNVASTWAIEIYTRFLTPVRTWSFETKKCQVLELPFTC